MKDFRFDEQSILNLKYYENAILEVSRKITNIENSQTLEKKYLNNSRSVNNKFGYGYWKEFESLCRDDNLVSKNVCQNN